MLCGFSFRVEGDEGLGCFAVLCGDGGAWVSDGSDVGCCLGDGFGDGLEVWACDLFAVSGGDEDDGGDGVVAEEAGEFFLDSGSASGAGEELGLVVGGDFFDSSKERPTESGCSEPDDDEDEWGDVGAPLSCWT